MLNRRAFLQSLAAMTAGIMVSGGGCAAPAKSGDGSGVKGAEGVRLGEALPRRRFGRTGQDVTMLGLGGYHVGLMEERDAQETIEAALDGGVRYFDTAESYEHSEHYYGLYLTPRYRDQVFISSKTTAPDAATARKHLQGTLDRLKTDHLDLWNIHAVNSPKDVDDRLARGVLDVMTEAQAQGRVRHVGFTGHAGPTGHRHMLEVLREKGEALVSCQMPINVVDPSYHSFIDNVLPLLVEQRYGVIAMKTLSGGTFFGKPISKGGPVPPTIVPDRMSLREAIHFVWSLPVSVVVSGPDTPAQYREMISLAKSFTALDEAQRHALVEKAAACAGSLVEWYKQ